MSSLRRRCHALLWSRCSLMSVPLPRQHWSKSKCICSEWHLKTGQLFYRILSKKSLHVFIGGVPLCKAVCSSWRNVRQVHGVRGGRANASIIEVNQDQITGFLPEEKNKTFYRENKYSHKMMFWPRCPEMLTHSQQQPHRSGWDGIPSGRQLEPWRSPAFLWPRPGHTDAANTEAGKGRAPWEMHPKTQEVSVSTCMKP